MQSDEEKVKAYIESKGATVIPPVTEENFWDMLKSRHERTGLSKYTGTPFIRGKRKRCRTA